MRLIVLLLTLLSISCNTHRSKYPYTLNHFRAPLRDHLQNIINEGLVTDHYGEDIYTVSLDYLFLIDSTTTKEFIELTNCEHPVIRGLVLSHLSLRKEIDPITIIYDHLDDTARIDWALGEFENEDVMIADLMLQDFRRWKSITQKDSVIRKIILKHNYLLSAFKKSDYILRNDSFPGLYHAIKTMALRDNYHLSERYYSIDLPLYMLASYKKKDDIPTIDSIMLENAKWGRFIGGHILTKYSDSTYFNVIEVFYPTRFYRSLSKSEYYDDCPGCSFAWAVAGFKTERSAAILKDMLSKLKVVNCGNVYNKMTDQRKENYRKQLLASIWENDCIAYKDIRTQIKEEYMGILKKEEAFNRKYNPWMFEEKKPHIPTSEDSATAIETQLNRW